MPRRSSLGIWDMWDPDYDEGLRRTAAALARQPEPPGRPDPVEMSAEPVPLDVAEEIATLTARVKAGDRSALSRLRRLLGR